MSVRKRFLSFLEICTIDFSDQFHKARNLYFSKSRRAQFCGKIPWLPYMDKKGQKMIFLLVFKKALSLDFHRTSFSQKLLKFLFSHRRSMKILIFDLWPKVLSINLMQDFPNSDISKNKSCFLYFTLHSSKKKKKKVT